MKIKQKLLITIATGIILVLGFYMITNLITKYTGFSVFGSKESEFVACLKEQDITLYLNTEDVARSVREIQLIDYLHYFKIKNCFVKNKECSEIGVSSDSNFIIWVINDNIINGNISFEELIKFSGCRL